MKQTILILNTILAICLITACKSAKELAMDGKYDKAVNKAVSELKKQPTNQETINILQLSFRNANNEDLGKINQIQYRNAPDRWDAIADLYKRLQDRQIKVSQILPFLSVHARSSIITSDYTIELASAQRNSANYKFSTGMNLLNSNSKSNARLAVEYFKQVKSYDASYPQIDQLIDEAVFRGTNHVLCEARDMTGYNLPYDFLRSLMPSSGINQALRINSYTPSPWITYYTIPQNNFSYDYVIQLNLRLIRSTPGRYDTRTNTYTQTIDDGWEYELDARGNVKKDANGNDIKRKKTKTIKYEVKETTQTKSVFIDATLDYIYVRNNRIVRSIPIGVEQPFVYTYVTNRGDSRAYQGQDQRHNDRPVPFPSDIDMIFAARDNILAVVYQALRDNERIVRSND